MTNKDKNVSTPESVILDSAVAVVGWLLAGLVAVVGWFIKSTIMDELALIKGRLAAIERSGGASVTHSELATAVRELRDELRDEMRQTRAEIRQDVHSVLDVIRGNR